MSGVLIIAQFVRSGDLSTFFVYFPRLPMHGHAFYPFFLFSFQQPPFPPPSVRSASDFPVTGIKKRSPSLGALISLLKPSRQSSAAVHVSSTRLTPSSSLFLCFVRGEKSLRPAPEPILEFPQISSHSAILYSDDEIKGKNDGIEQMLSTQVS